MGGLLQLARLRLGWQPWMRTKVDMLNRNPGGQNDRAYRQSGGGKSGSCHQELRARDTRQGLDKPGAGMCNLRVHFLTPQPVLLVDTTYTPSALTKSQALF